MQKLSLIGVIWEKKTSILNLEGLWGQEKRNDMEKL